MEIVLASHNKKKIKELEAELEALRLEIKEKHNGRPVLSV